MVTVQSGANWRMLPAVLGWRECERRRTGREIAAEWRVSRMERERLPVYLFHIFLFLLCHLTIDFSPYFTIYLSHNSVCLPIFPPSTTSTHSFFIYQAHSSTNTLRGLNINVAKNLPICQCCGINFLKLMMLFAALF